MPFTSGGIYYPSSSDAPRVWEDMQALAESVQTELLDPKPRCHAFDTVGNACLNVTSKLINWDANQYDNALMHDLGSSLSRIVFPVAGLYDIDVQMMFPTGTYSGASVMNIRQNAAGSSAGGTSLTNHYFNIAASGTAIPHARFLRSFGIGDYLEVFINQSSGGTATNSSGAYTSRFFATCLELA